MRALPVRPLLCSAVLLLGIGTTWGLAVEHTTTDGADQPGKKEQPAKPPAKPDKADKSGLKKIKFQAAGLPWKDVFQWLAKETGKPIISIYKPTGTFTVQVPEGAAYTLPDTIDLVNEALIDQKYILIQKERSFTLVPADEKVDPALVPNIDVKDLGKRGQTEIVRTTLQLHNINAEDMQEQVKRLMGKFSEVAAFPAANQLVLTDTVASIKRVIETLRKVESDQGGLAETYSHVCEYIPAREAERVLKDLLGEPAKQPPQPVLPQFGRDGRPIQQPPQQPMPKRKVHRITSDETRNMVLVTGPADIIAKARDIVRKIDVSHLGQPRVIIGPAVLKTYDVPAGKAEPIAKTLQEAYKSGGNIRISTAGNSTILVYAGPEDQIKIIRLIKEGTEGGTDTKSYAVNNIDIAKAVELLKAIFGDNKAGAPTIEGLAERNAVVVHGTPEQIKQVANAIKVLDGGSIEGGDTGRMRVITLGQGSASAMADLLERMLKQMRQNPVRVISPTRGLPRPGQLMPKEEEDKEKKKEEDKPKRKTSLDSPRLDLVVHESSPGFIDPQKEEKKEEPKKPVLPGKVDKPLTITAFGNRLILTSDDKEALAVASELVRLFLKTPADAADFEVIRLKNANAAEAAKVLDEAFNGRREQTQAINPFFNRFGGRGAAVPVDPRPDRIRVVADPSINSLIIRASPLDMVSVHRLIEKAIDSGKSDSAALIKRWHLGPLHNASAQEVAKLLLDIYKDQTRQEAPETSVGGFRGFEFRNFQGRNADGSPRPVSLAVGVDERTNSLLLACSASTYMEIEKLVGQMEEAAGKAKSTINIVPSEGIDPVLLQQAVDAIRGRGRTGARGQGSGGREGSPGSSLAPRPSPLAPREAPPPGGPPDRRRSAGDEPQGPRFFEHRVKDDPQPSPFIDPQLSDDKTSHDATPPLLNLQPQGQRPEVGQRSGAIKLVAHEAQAQPPKPGAPEVVAPRREVNVEGFNDLGIMVIRTENPEDAAAVLQIIKIIREKARGAEIQIRLVELKEADATSIVGTLNLLFQRVQVGPSGFGNSLFTPRTATQSTILGQTQSAQLQAASVALIPLPRFNAILVATARARMKEVIREITRLDKKNAKQTQLVSFRLKKASAARVATLVNTFWATRYPLDSNQIRVTYEDSTNQVFVQAAPGDLAEIQQLIWNIDNTFSGAKNDIRIVFLKQAIADQVAALLLRAINDGVITSTNPAGLTPLLGGGVAGRAGAGGLIGALGAGGGAGGAGGILGGVGGLGAGGGGALGGAAGGAGAGGAIGGPRGGPGTTLTQGPGGAGVAGAGSIGGGGITTKSTSVRFIMPGGPTAESGNLEDIHITPDIRANLLILAAPQQTMELLLLLINALDVRPAVQAEINVFTLKKADATFTANLLNQLFSGVSTGVGGISTTTGGVGAGAGGGAGGGAPLSTTTSYPFLVPLRITVDTRSNSIVVAGSLPDLLRVEAIINQLEATDIPTRQNQVYKLRNSTAVDVANALQTFITNSLAIYENNLQFSYLQEIQQQVVVVAEPITNKLLISATDRYFGEIMRLIHELDAEQPMVVIQTLFVEVDLTGSEEFGIEFGLQSPVLFQRSIDNNGVTVNGTGNIGSTRTISQTGFNFFNPALNLPNSDIIGPQIVGVQGVTNLGTGRVSPNSGIGGFVFSAQSDVFNLLIRALKTQGRVDVLSRPQVMTLDNQFARVLVGQDFPYILGTNLTATGISQQNVNYRSIGIELQVTPRISPEGKVLMRVVPTVSSVSPTPQALGNGTLAPVFNVQTVETTVGVEDGETVALGGLISTRDAKAENKVPYFGDLPGIGSLFRFRTQIKSKTELMIILTPHIVRNRADADRIMATEARRMDWIVGDIVRAHGTTGFEPLLPTPVGSIDPLTVAPAPPVTPRSPLYSNLLAPPPRLVSPPPPPALQPMFPGIPGPGVMPGDALPPPHPLGPILPEAGGLKQTSGLEVSSPEPPLPPAPAALGMEAQPRNP